MAVEDFEALTLVGAWLALSDAELGVETVLRNLFLHGVAVHTSAMLQTEQSASEWMFSHLKAPLMFATGTLAQSYLNFARNSAHRHFVAPGIFGRNSGHQLKF